MTANDTALAALQNAVAEHGAAVTAEIAYVQTLVAAGASANDISAALNAVTATIQSQTAALTASIPSQPTLPAPPAPSFSWAPLGSDPLTMIFGGSESDSTATLHWDFGDTQTADGWNVQHTYAAAGTYQITLTATVNGVSTTSFQNIVVSAPVSTAPNFTWTPDVMGGHAIDFTADGGTVAGHGWTWDFGDTQTSTLPTPIHAYAAAGTYTVTLTIFANGTPLSTSSQTVVVD